MSQQIITVRGPHRPRPITFIGPHEDAGWRLKVYGIASEGGRPPQELTEAALKLAPEVFPSPAVQHDRYGIGFVVVHRAGDFCFVLYDWWAGENEIHQRLYSAPLDDPTALAPHPTPAIFCVWEGAAVDHERRAWLRHVLANPGGPDVEAYFADTFEGEV
ncbi:hypothetical protein [Actinomadura rudentiformis]|uniref:Isochorismatase n=1 Tax=Actinomadura rudentiformis TaxID=359158 RepID=A0A6H9Z0G7_9ACTN|nr:hypothetical protein [Actinomadura rudentiformis]KAB2352660.1 hypothetical protein F8566_03165 [Actinomadura rudentiformis]